MNKISTRVFINRVRIHILRKFRNEIEKCASMLFGDHGTYYSLHMQVQMINVTKIAWALVNCYLSFVFNYAYIGQCPHPTQNVVNHLNYIVDLVARVTNVSNITTILSFFFFFSLSFFRYIYNISIWFLVPIIIYNISIWFKQGTFLMLLY